MIAPFINHYYYSVADLGQRGPLSILYGTFDSAVINMMNVFEMVGTSIGSNILLLISAQISSAQYFLNPITFRIIINYFFFLSMACLEFFCDMITNKASTDS